MADSATIVMVVVEKPWCGGVTSPSVVANLI